MTSLLPNRQSNERRERKQQSLRMGQIADDWRAFEKIGTREAPIEGRANAQRDDATSAASFADRARSWVLTPGLSALIWAYPTLELEQPAPRTSQASASAAGFSFLGSFPEVRTRQSESDCVKETVAV